MTISDTLIWNLKEETDLTHCLVHPLFCLNFIQLICIQCAKYYWDSFLDSLCVPLAYFILYLQFEKVRITLETYTLEYRTSHWLEVKYITRNKYILLIYMIFPFIRTNFSASLFKQTQITNLLFTQNNLALLPDQ